VIGSPQEPTDLIYEGIATAVSPPNLRAINLEPTDLIYEGIATPNLRAINLTDCREPTDLIYEGIATIMTALLHSSISIFTNQPT